MEFLDTTQASRCSGLFTYHPETQTKVDYRCSLPEHKKKISSTVSYKFVLSSVVAGFVLKIDVLSEANSSRMIAQIFMKIVLHFNACFRFIQVIMGDIVKKRKLPFSCNISTSRI